MMNAHERAEILRAALTILTMIPDREDAPNPTFLNGTLNRIGAAQKEVLDAVEHLAIAVDEEWEYWELGPPPWKKVGA